MTKDISELLLNKKEVLEIKDNVIIPEEYLSNSNIRRLDKVSFTGNITKLVDDTISLEGILQGVMVLPDDITLEDVSCHFKIKIEEKIENFTNLLDITDILWQNILVEIPSKVHSNKTENTTLQGDGWRVITESDFANEHTSNKPFANLKQILEEREDR